MSGKVASDKSVVVAVITGLFSVLVTLIGAAVTIYKANGAKESAQGAASSAAAAKEDLVHVQKIVAATPGAVTTQYRGSKTQPNASTERFDFSEKIYDPQKSVTIGRDWRLVVPFDGTYLIGANFQLPFGQYGSSHTNPYVSCTVKRLKAGTATAETLSRTIAFNPACALTGVYSLRKADQIFVELGESGAYSGLTTGEFYSAFIGPRQDR